MYYEINITLHGTHFFATAERSITDGVKLLRVYNQLRGKFLRADGFEISARRVEKVSVSVDIDTMLTRNTEQPNNSHRID